MEQSVVLRNAQVIDNNVKDIEVIYTWPIASENNDSFRKKTMLSTFHIEKVINNNKELFTRHLLCNYLIFKP